jgi:histidyl-tRNA synthetase
MFTRQRLPGVGASLGLDRILAAMETLNMIPAGNSTAQLLIVQFEAHSLDAYLKIAAAIRRSGVRVEVYPEARKLSQQFKYADRQQVQAVLVAGPEELERREVLIKWMSDSSQTVLPLSDNAQEIIDWLHSRL